MPRRLAYPVVAAVLCAGLAGSASALILGDTLTPPGNCSAPPVPRPLPDLSAKLPAELVDELFDWIDEATPYDTAAARHPPPSVALCNAGEAIRYEGETLTVPDDLRGAYDQVNRRILLVRPWAPNSPRDRSVLLHELIHHVQLHNRGWDCLQAPEWQAYKLQELWLAERGIDSGFDWLQIYFQSRCPRDHHP